NGVGTYTASIIDGTLEVSGDAWTLSRDCSSTPSRVRITALPAGHHYLGTIDPGGPVAPEDRIAASATTLYAMDYWDGRIHPIDIATGVEGQFWEAPDTPVDIAVSSLGVFVLCKDANVYRYDTSGTLQATYNL